MSSLGVTYGVYNSASASIHIKRKSHVFGTWKHTFLQHFLLYPLMVFSPLLVVVHSQKPYACQIPGCTKRYTDPSSLRKHVKAHSAKGLQEREVKVTTAMLFWHVGHLAESRMWLLLGSPALETNIFNKTFLCL